MNPESDDRARTTERALERARSATIVAVVGVVMASIASIASTVQSFIAWSGRDDHLETVLVSEAIGRCGSMKSALAQNYANAAAILSGQLSTGAFIDVMVSGQSIVGDVLWLAIVASPSNAAVSDEFSSLAQELGELIEEFGLTMAAITGGQYDGDYTDYLARLATLNASTETTCNRFVVELLS